MARQEQDGLSRTRIAKRQLLAIEHPCYVVDVQCGMRMLGGALAIARASTSKSDCIECCLRPEDPLSHPLFGVKTPTPGFLLKVRRRKSTPSLATAEAIGTIASSYRFDGLADYQYVSDAPLRTALDVRPCAAGVAFDIVEKLGSLQASALRIPPALFSMHDMPLEYMPRSQKTGRSAGGMVGVGGTQPEVATDTAIAPIGGLKPRRRRARPGLAVPMHFGQRIDFATEASPQAPPEHIAKTIDPSDELYAVMKDKFAQRPIWSRQALRASLPASMYLTEERLRFRLPQLAYYFSQGPWRMCWIAFGYDPRVSPDSRIYQVLDMRLPTEFEHLVPKKSERSRIGAPARIRRGYPGMSATTADAAAAGSGERVDTGVALRDGGGAFDADGAEPAEEDARGLVPGDQSLPTQRHVYFQMCDFSSEDIVQIVHEEYHRPVGDTAPSCHERTGWYTQSTIERLRKLLKQALSQLAKAQEDAHAADLSSAAAGPSLGAPAAQTAELPLAARAEPSSAHGALRRDAGAVPPLTAGTPGLGREASIAAPPTLAAVGVTQQTSFEAFGIFGDDVHGMHEEGLGDDVETAIDPDAQGPSKMRRLDDDGEWEDSGEEAEEEEGVDDELLEGSEDKDNDEEVEVEQEEEGEEEEEEEEGEDDDDDEEEEEEEEEEDLLFRTD